MHLEGEGADGYERAREHEREDHDRRAHHEHRERDAADREGRRKEVVGGLGEVHVDQEHPDDRQQDEPGKPTEGGRMHVEVEETAGRIDGRDAHHDERDEHRSQAEPGHLGQALPQAEGHDGRDRQQQRRTRDDQASSTALSLMMRKAPARATTTSSHASESVIARCGSGTSRASSCTPVMSSRAASDTRTALRAVSMTATPLERSQTPETSAMIPDPSPNSGSAADSPEIVRNEAYAIGVTMAAVNVPSQRRQPGSSP